MNLRKFSALVSIALLSLAMVLTECPAAPTATSAPTTTTAPTTEPTSTTAPTPTVSVTTDPGATTAPTTTAAPTATTAPTKAPTPKPTATPVPLSGTLTAAGSTALQPLAQQAATEFMALHSLVSVTVNGGGSGGGLSQVNSGAVDIGDSDVYASEKLPADAADTLVDHKVCVAGFATILNPGITGITSLTQAQLINIFTGVTTNWKDVGGPDLSIVIINRPASSGTRFTYDKYALNGAAEATGLALTEDSNGTVRATVASTPGAISYVAFSYLDASVTAIGFNGVAPTPENVKNGTYKIWSFEHMYTKGTPSALEQAFLDYMVSATFASQVTALKYIPISQMTVLTH